MTYGKKKKIIITLLAVFLIAAGVLAFANTSWAAATTTPALGTKGLQMKDIGAIGAPVMVVVQGVLWVLLAILVSIFNLVASVLNSLFVWSVGIIPSGYPHIVTMWGVVRDIVNAFFILIILWIAFTIIFNLEQFGGKKLLTKVIMVALLINFSLVMVTAVFAFANQLAFPFASKITAVSGDNGVGGYIVNAIKLQSIMERLDPEAAEEVKEQYNPNTNTSGQTSTQSSTNSVIGDALLASLGVQTARAGIVEGVAGCGAGMLLGGFVVGFFTAGAGWLATAAGWAACGGFALIAGQFDFVTNSLFSVFNESFRESLLLALSIMFVTIALVAFIYAIFGLLVRLIIMNLLAVTAPAALLLAVAPIKYTQQYWNKWATALFQWAFFLPIFYFFMFLGLLSLGTLNNLSPQETFAPLDMNRVLGLIVTLGFFIAGYKVAKQGGGVIANAIMGALTTVTLAATTGGLGLAAAGARRMIPKVMPPEGRVAEGLRRVAETPGLRWVGGRIPQALGAEAIERGRRAVEEKEKQNATLSRPDTISRYKTAVDPEEKMALLKRLTEKEWLKGANLAPQQMKDAASLAERYGMHRDLAKKNLLFINEDNYKKFYPETGSVREARKEHLSKMRPTDVAQISDDALDSGLAQDMWQTLGPAYISSIQRENPSLMGKLNEELRNNPNWTSGMKPETYQFMKSNLSSGMYGLSLPENAPAPAGLVNERVRRLDEQLEEQRAVLRDKQTRLLTAAAGELAERKKEIGRIERKIETLESQRRARGGGGATPAGATPPPTP